MKDKLKKHKIAITVAACLFVIDLTITGFLKFGYNVARCGGAPVAVLPAAFDIGPMRYLEPGNYTPGGVSTKYFCSAQESIDNGYVRDPLQGP